MAKKPEKKKDEKIEYVICPRCELNYISKRQKYCDICNAELSADAASRLLPDEDEENEKLCPACKSNYMGAEDEMCFVCLRERADRAEVENDDSWRDYLEDEIISPIDNTEISFSELEEEEEAENDEEPLSDEDDFEYVDPDDEEFDDDEDFSDED